MSKRLLVMLVLMLASFFVSCSQDEAERGAEQKAVEVLRKVEAIVKVDQFQVPASLTITEEKAKMYAKASGALVELGVSWTDRIDKASDNDKVQILNAYNVARDQLCARIGLAGIAEYNWITENALRAPENKEVFKSVGIKAK